MSELGVPLRRLPLNDNDPPYENVEVIANSGRDVPAPSTELRREESKTAQYGNLEDITRSGNLRKNGTSPSDRPAETDIVYEQPDGNANGRVDPTGFTAITRPSVTAQPETTATEGISKSDSRADYRYTPTIKLPTHVKPTESDVMSKELDRYRRCCKIWFILTVVFVVISLGLLAAVIALGVTRQQSQDAVMVTTSITSNFPTTSTSEVQSSTPTTTTTTIAVSTTRKSMTTATTTLRSTKRLTEMTTLPSTTTVHQSEHFSDSLFDTTIPMSGPETT